MIRTGASAASNVTLCVEPSPTLEQFVEPLLLLPSIDVSTQGRQITLGAFRISQKLHRDLPNTTLYAYGECQEAASFPGPTLMARRGIPAQIRWENHILDERHFLEIDNTIYWANPQLGGVPIVTHLHGAEVESASDGHPDAWFTAHDEIGPSFVSQNYTYPNFQPPAALWYHDNTIGITRLNVMAGLSGFYIIRGSPEEELSLPLGILLFIKDWRFFANGSIHFRTHGSFAGEDGWCPEYGDTMLVNGKVWPYLRVFPRVYRFRVLNGCNARFLDLSLSNSSLSFLQIGTDGGFLPEARARDSLLMSPGERVDVLIDFTGLENGTEVLLSNSAPSPFPYADSAYFSIGTADVMKFIVVEENGSNEGLADGDGKQRKRLLIQLRKRVATATTKMSSMTMHPGEAGVKVTRSFNLTRKSAVDGRPPANRIGQGRWWEDYYAGGNEEDEVISCKPGDTEVWEIINVSEDAHNMQIHLVQFQMLSQQSFDMDGYEEGVCSIRLKYGEAGSCYLEEARGAETYQEGWKDTMIMWPSNVTRVVLRWGPRDDAAGTDFCFDPTLGPGYVWNSATPDHQDYQMIKRIRLISPSVSLASSNH
ncbi:hypothetical protein GOP47_0000641 [Adiantum capillus-veneris]|uniref:Plastocyanin-like domain-containing protein n=1 Tax=Adiantum capillus-veneris TaxID=13818 RepID=A0A9D4ZT38_ADICA|nr:hypothetical protein GOP47_0000641 [Adiantum capillus-veneris]